MSIEPTNIRVRVGVDIREHVGHTVRSVVIDKGAAIKALYCVQDKLLVEYLFRRSRGWDEQSAIKWAGQHAKGFESFNHIAVDQSVEFLKVVALKASGESVSYEPNSPSFIYAEKQETRWETGPGATNQHNHGIADLDEDGNGELAEGPNAGDDGVHTHKVLNFKIQPGGADSHTHELGKQVGGADVRPLSEGTAQLISEDHQDAGVQAKAVVAFQDLPKAPQNRAWDGAAAEGRVRSWAGGPEKDNVDFAKYRKAFVYFDPDDTENFSGYKLGIADVIDGSLHVVFRGVVAAFGALRGARGGVNIPDADKRKAMAHVLRYYDKFDVDRPEDTEVKTESVDVAQGELEIVKVDEGKRLVYGVFLVPEKPDHDGDVISVADVEKVAHDFMAIYRNIDEMHGSHPIEADIVESAISWEDGLNFHGKTLPLGSWFGAVKIHDDAVWAKVKSGEYKGFSVRISGVREPIGEGA